MSEHKPIQGEIWEKLTTGLDESNSIILRCETKRARELENAFDKLNKQFQTILNAEQQHIFSKLMEVAMDIESNAREQSIGSAE